MKKLLLGLWVLAACGGDERGMTPEGDAGAGTDSSTTEPTGLALLGLGSHDPASVRIEVLATPEDGLAGSRDVAVHPDPERANELWIVNRADSSIVVVFDAGLETRRAQKFDAPGNTHFLAKPAALAFGADGFFATAQDEGEITQLETPADFMGPTLWTSDMTIFDGGHAGHMDMLHNSPNSVGVAWEVDHVYWIYDGHHGALTRYDFGEDHGPGGADHSDGEIIRYVDGQLGYDPEVSSHLYFDRDTGFLYAADTANNRIVILDTYTGEPGATLRPNYDGGRQFVMDNAAMTTMIDGANTDLRLQKPSGVVLRDGVLYVADNATSEILAFTTDGQLLDYLPLSGQVEAGGLMGLDFDAEGRLYAADAKGNQILRVSTL